MSVVSKNKRVIVVGLLLCTAICCDALSPTVTLPKSYEVGVAPSDGIVPYSQTPSTSNHVMPIPSVTWNRQRFMPVVTAPLQKIVIGTLLFGDTMNGGPAGTDAVTSGSH